MNITNVRDGLLTIIIIINLNDWLDIEAITKLIVVMSRGLATKPGLVGHATRSGRQTPGAGPSDGDQGRIDHGRWNELGVRPARRLTC